MLKSQSTSKPVDGERGALRTRPQNVHDIVALPEAPSTREAVWPRKLRQPTEEELTSVGVLMAELEQALLFQPPYAQGTVTFAADGGLVHQMSSGHPWATWRARALRRIRFFAEEYIRQIKLKAISQAVSDIMLDWGRAFGTRTGLTFPLHPKGVNPRSHQYDHGIEVSHTVTRLYGHGYMTWWLDLGKCFY